LGGGQHHLRVDGAGLRVEQAAEHTREDQHVVDLVREVRASGGHNGRRLTGDCRVHLGVRVREREHDGAVGHGGDVGGVQDVRGGDADEDVRAAHGLLQGAAEVLGVGVVGDPAQRGAGGRVDEVLAAGVHHTVDVGHHGVLDAGGEQQLEDGGTGRTGTGHHHADALDGFLRDPQGVGEGGEHDDGGAVLVVVEDGDV